MTFEIPIKVNSRLGLNSLYAGKHWSVRKKEADEVHFIVKNVVRKLKGVKPFNEPVEIKIRYNTRLDIDNTGYITKLLIDSLKGYIIIDDDKRFIKRLIVEFQDESKNVIIEVRELVE